MKISVRHHARVSVVDLSGEVAIPKEVRLREALLELLDQKRLLILLNLKNVTWMDSAGIGELIACQKRARARGGVVKLLNPSERVYRVLEIMSLLKPVFEVFHDERDALASFSEPSLERGKRPAVQEHG